MSNYYKNSPRSKRSQPPKKNYANLIVVFLAGFLAFIIAFNLYLAMLPPIKNLKTYSPNLVTQFVSQDGEIIKTFSAYKAMTVKPEDVPNNLKYALIATEDKNFYRHRGYDLFALFRSIFFNIQTSRYSQGASTITQQLARILFLSNEKTIDRKVKELVISNRIEKSLSKDEILAFYLSTVYLGEGAYGAAAAADVYFGKTLDQLSLAECALIAGLPQAPSIYSPYKRPDLALKRRAVVLKRMRKQGYITKEQYKQAMHEPIYLQKNHSRTSLNKAPYFVDYALKELDSLGFSEQEISRGGYKVTTTLNYHGQEAAQIAINKYLQTYGLNSPDEQVSLFSMDVSNGKILAYMGGKDYRESQYDRVTQAVRQPGSSFKVFVYAAAIQAGKTPNDVYDDLPFHMGPWSPKNYGNKYRRQLPLHTALALSSNVIAVRLLKEIGMDNTIRMARDLGISTPIEKNLTLALGTNAVKMYEIVRAYSAFANAGIQPTPYAIDKVETSSGEVLYQARPGYKRVLDPYVAASMTAMLQRVVESGTGKAARIPNRQIAGKTGTTDDYRDAWFIGYTPEIVTGVWVGNDKNKAHKKVTGGSVPALIWHDYMVAALQNIPYTGFNYPEIILDKTDLPAGAELQPSEEVVPSGGSQGVIISSPKRNSEQDPESNNMIQSIPPSQHSNREDLLLKEEERPKSQPKQVAPSSSSRPPSSQQPLPPPRPANIRVE
ncbi:MAG: PBP1A family penicillin-binding protein [Candidatus Gastranaerophilales bacterium]|nr:PBP1A family penicillin-binding protein [Candidatus Gastranaerophilales bacterium]